MSVLPLFMILALCHFYSAFSQNSEIHVPWTYCTTNVTEAKYGDVYDRASKNLQLTCEPGPGDMAMDYYMFEEFAYSLWNYTLEVTVRCKASNVSVDFRAYTLIANLMVVDITGCFVSNYSGGYREYFFPRNTTEAWFQQDNVQFVKYEKCMRQSMLEDIVIYLENYPSVPDCDSLKAKSIQISSCHLKVDVSAIYQEPNASWYERWLNATFNPNNRPVPNRCLYENLLHLDYSGNIWYSDNNIKAALTRSLYPKLQKLNVSHTSIGAIPDTFEDWSWINFPNLVVADFSYCNIKEFHFVDRRVDTLGNVHVDLRGNQISEFKPENMRVFGYNTTFLVDLRGNLMTCDCTDTFKETLKTLNNTVGLENTDSYYQYLWDLKCDPDNSTKQTGHLLHQTTLRAFHENIDVYCERRAPTYTTFTWLIVLSCVLFSLTAICLIGYIIYKKNRKTAKTEIFCRQTL